MNILQVCANYPPIAGGHGIYAQNLSVELSKHNVNTTVLTFKPSSINTTELNDKLNVKRIRALNLSSIEYPVYGPNILYHIHKIVKDQDIDVINSHTRFFTSTYFASLYKKLNKDVLFVHTEHGAGPLVHKNKVVSSICNTYDHTFGKWAINTADIPIAIGPSSRAFLNQLGCTQNVELIPNSIDCSNFCKTQYNIAYDKGSEIIITYIGRLVESKGVLDLIEIFSQLSAHYDLRLWIVGDGPDEYYFKHIVKSKGIKNIEFIGFRQDISDILYSTDIFVNPSYYDSVPTTILEAGCVGTRVISSDVGDSAYLLGFDYPYLYGVGSLDTLRDHLIQIIEESDFSANELKSRVHKMFNWELNSKKYIDLLNSKFK